MSDFEGPEAIICSPFEEPAHYWRLEEGAEPEKRPGRRPAFYYYPDPISQDSAGTVAPKGTAIELKLVSLIRSRVKEWRAAGNDEAHHAYRIRKDEPDAEEEDLLGEEGEAEEFYKEATVWIDGLDRVQKLRGINSRSVALIRAQVGLGSVAVGQVVLVERHLSHCVGRTHSTSSDRRRRRPLLDAHRRPILAGRSLSAPGGRPRWCASPHRCIDMAPPPSRTFRRW